MNELLAQPVVIDNRAGANGAIGNEAVAKARPGKLNYASSGTGEKRSSVMTDSPTLAESGLAGYQTGTWYGILAPAGTSPDVIARLNQETLKVLALPEVKERFLTQAIEPAGSTPAQFAAYLRNELSKWARVIKAGGIKVE